MKLSPPPGWTPALALLTGLLARPAPSDLRTMAARMTPLEWDAFADQTIHRQRLAPLVAAHLADLPIPDGPREAIVEAARRDAMETLARMAETRRILDRFSGIGVQPLVLKGWPLALRLFGDAGLRQGRDLDLYIPAEALPACHGAITELGYRPDRNLQTRAHLIGGQTLLRECNDIEYHHVQTGHTVELAWRAHPVAGFPDLLSAPGATRIQDTPAGPVRVPEESVDLVYLALHGTLHMWLRLKWLLDIARLAERRGPDALEHDLARARSAGVETPVALSLVLAAGLFASPLPASLSTPPPRLLRAAASVMTHIARPEHELKGLGARLSFYRFALPIADSAAQRLGLLRLVAWRRIGLGLARLAPRPAPGQGLP